MSDIPIVDFPYKKTIAKFRITNISNVIYGSNTATIHILFLDSDDSILNSLSINLTDSEYSSWTNDSSLNTIVANRFSFLVL